MKPRCDWEVPDTPSACVCGDICNVDDAMMCKRSGFAIH